MEKTKSLEELTMQELIEIINNKDCEGEFRQAVENEYNRRLDSSKDQLLFKHDVENTPFTITKDETKSTTLWYVHLGVYIMHPKDEPFLSEEQALEYAKELSWEKIIKVILAFIDSNNKININIENTQS